MQTGESDKLMLQPFAVLLPIDIVVSVKIFALMFLLRLGYQLKIRLQTARALDQAVHTINWTGAKSICNFCCPLRQIQTHNKLELLKTFHLCVSLIVFFIRWIHFCTLCALWRSFLTFKNLYFHDKFLKHSRYDKVKMEEISRITYFAREKK